MVYALSRIRPRKRGAKKKPPKELKLKEKRTTKFLLEDQVIINIIKGQ